MMELTQQDGSGLLIHHWDTDGLCSARLLLEHLNREQVDNNTPTLGNYFLSDDEIDACEAYDFIIVADMSLPNANIEKLRTRSHVLIFDHHLGKVMPEIFHCNPIIKGKDPQYHPSASWIINDYLNQNPNLFAILGVVGDHEYTIKTNKVIYPHISDYCKLHNCTFDDLINMARLIDSNYKIGDKRAVESVPQALFSVTEPKHILNHKTWQMNQRKLEAELERQLSQPVEIVNGTIMKRMNSSFNLISTVTRFLSWTHKKDVIVINTGFFDHEDQLYVRSPQIDMQSMIQRGKERGYKCGGKKEVLGAILPKEKTENFVLELLTFLNQKNSLGGQE